jgi:hypothetical protein
MNRGRVGEERRGKETNGCPLRGVRGGFSEVQWVNSTPLLSSYNYLFHIYR